MNINYNPSRHVAGAVVAVAAAGLLDGEASEEAHSDDVMTVVVAGEVLPANKTLAGMGVVVVVVVVPLDEDDMKDFAAGPRLGLSADLHAGIHSRTPVGRRRLRKHTRR